jgi:hypothetical protein
MIKFSNQVPSVYPNTSRDFQYLCWLFDIVLNSVKHNVDNIYNLPDNKAAPKLTELLALTLGFKIKRNYDQNQLSALVAALPRILKYKGTKTAVDMAGNALIAASGASGYFKSETSDDTDELNKGELRVTFPVGLIDISLFTDLLEYILPAGMTCKIVRKNEMLQNPTIDLRYEDRNIANWIPDLDWQPDELPNKTLPGLANMFDVYSLEEFDFSNYINDAESDMINVGLLNNNIIPNISGAMTGSDKTFEDSHNLEHSSSETTTVIENRTKEKNIDGITVRISG